MKVLISIFQVFVMVMVVLFSIGALEIVSYRTVNKPLVYSYFHNEFEPSEHEAVSPDFFQMQHWKIVWASATP